MLQINHYIRNFPLIFIKELLRLTKNVISSRKQLLLFMKTNVKFRDHPKELINHV